MVRLKYLPRLTTATETWFMDANLLSIWSAVEPGLGIIASSLATLRPLFRGLFRTGTTNMGSSSNNNGGTGHGRFLSFKNGAIVEELPVRSGKEEEPSPYDSFAFIQGGIPSIKGAPAGPHQHIAKEPWKPRALAGRRAPSRIGKAEELLGEDLSAFTQPQQLGNTVSCERLPPDVFAKWAGQPAIRRCSSKSRLHGYMKG